MKRFILSSLLLLPSAIFALPSSKLNLRADESDLQVKLAKYGTFQGITLEKDSGNKQLAQPVNAWLGVTYASPNRFAEASPPKPFNGVRDATQYGPACPQSGNSKQAEDCLSLNVFRPANIPLNKKLPVMLWIHGGSFVMGSGRSIGEQFVANSDVPVMAVTFQYRLGALGSLPSKLFEDEGILNLGVRDQHQFLEFIQDHIEEFGGDPKAITLAGQSAGAHSVSLQYFHDYGVQKGKPLFNRVILASGSPTARQFPPVDYPAYKTQFSEFMTDVGCPESPNDEALECLRSIDVNVINTAQNKIYNDNGYAITWPFQPASPGPWIEKHGSKVGEQKLFFKLPLLTSSCTDEGISFAPKNLTTNDQVLKFMANVNLGLNKQDISDLNDLYTDPATDPDSPYTNSTHSEQFKRISAMYGDYAYICPVQETAVRVSGADVPVYKARFNTDGSPDGVGHSSDISYISGLQSAKYPEIARQYHAYYVSFVVAGDPNKYKAKDAPKWEKFQGNDPDHLVVNPNGAKMEKEGDGIRVEQCKWWRDEQRMERLNK